MNEFKNLNTKKEHEEYTGKDELSREDEFIRLVEYLFLIVIGITLVGALILTAISKIL